MKTQRHHKKGFTLIETMIVVGIIALLAAVIIPSVLNSLANAREKIKQRNVVNIEKAKGILQLPPSIHALGKGLEPGARYGTDFTEEELFACLGWVEKSEDLEVHGEPIVIGDIGESAYYPSSGAASKP